MKTMKQEVEVDLSALLERTTEAILKQANMERVRAQPLPDAAPGAQATGHRGADERP